MSGLAASLMSTRYFRTKRRMMAVVMLPHRPLATRPANTVIACLGKRYCGKTAVRSDTAEPVAKRIENYSGARSSAAAASCGQGQDRQEIQGVVWCQILYFLRANGL